MLKGWASLSGIKGKKARGVYHASPINVGKPIGLLLCLTKSS